jgi:FkbM family methyltransferase
VNIYKQLRLYTKLRPQVANAWEVMRAYAAPRGDVPVVLRNGAVLTLRAAQQDATIFRRIFAQDEYRLRAWEERLHGDVVDLGANVGLFACRVAARAARVICYEPMPENFARLQANTAALRNVTPVRAAVSDRAGTMRIYCPINTTYSGGFTQYPVADLHQTQVFEDVPATTLEAVFAAHGVAHCALLKMDVEGGEYDILYAAPAEVLRRIERMAGEYHNVRPDDPRAQMSALAAHLNQHGFDVELVPKRRLPNHGLFFARRTADGRPGATISTGPGTR